MFVIFCVSATQLGISSCKAHDSIIEAGTGSRAIQLNLQSDISSTTQWCCKIHSSLPDWWFYSTLHFPQQNSYFAAETTRRIFIQTSVWKRLFLLLKYLYTRAWPPPYLHVKAFCFAGSIPQLFHVCPLWIFLLRSMSNTQNKQERTVRGAVEKFLDP